MAYMPLFSFRTIPSHNTKPHCHLIGWRHVLLKDQRCKTGISGTSAMPCSTFRHMDIVACSTSMFCTLWHIRDPLTILEISDVYYRRSFDNPEDLDTSTMWKDLPHGQSTGRVCTWRGEVEKRLWQEGRKEGKERWIRKNNFCFLVTENWNQNF